jgi:hypothetical protein
VLALGPQAVLSPCRSWLESRADESLSSLRRLVSGSGLRASHVVPVRVASPPPPPTIQLLLHSFRAPGVRSGKPSEGFFPLRRAVASPPPCATATSQRRISAPSRLLTTPRLAPCRSSSLSACHVTPAPAAGPCGRACGEFMPGLPAPAAGLFVCSCGEVMLGLTPRLVGHSCEVSHTGPAPSVHPLHSNGAATPLGGSPTASLRSASASRKSVL